MKKLILIGVVLLIAASVSFAGESSCPADRATKVGFHPFGDFHHLLAPVWHNAWAEKDFKTLLEAGPKFEKLFAPIAEMNPKLKSESKLEKFKKNRIEFGKAVKLYAEACKAGDKEKAYELMPNLHNTFEMTASALLPLTYPEFDGFVISFNLLNENHIPANNIDGIKGTVATLTAKLDGLNKKTIPTELAGEKVEILKKFSEIKRMVALMQKCCDKNDMETLKGHAKELSLVLDKFVEKYI